MQDKVLRDIIVHIQRSKCVITHMICLPLTGNFSSSKTRCTHGNGMDTTHAPAKNKRYKLLSFMFVYTVFCELKKIKGFFLANVEREIHSGNHISQVDSI